MKIETNPVKIAYFDYLQLEDCLKVASECQKSIKKLTRKFTEEQLKQYTQLMNGSLTLDMISSPSVPCVEEEKLRND